MAYGPGTSRPASAFVDEEAHVPEPGAPGWPDHSTPNVEVRRAGDARRATAVIGPRPITVRGVRFLAATVYGWTRRSPPVRNRRDADSIVSGGKGLGRGRGSVDASRDFSSRLIRAKVCATFVCVAGVYRKAFERHDTCPFGKVFVISASSLCGAG
jgi:hypothetical protein